MPRMIEIFDTTLRDGEQAPGINLGVEEKLRIARRLQKLGVDIIEAGFPASSENEARAVQSIARTVKGSAIAGLCRVLNRDIDTAWESLKEAEKPYIHLFVSTSDIHLQYKLRKTRDEVLAMIREAVSHAAGYTPFVQFSAEDGSRTDPAFLETCFQAALEAGASCVNVADTLGYALPDEFGSLIARLVKAFPGVPVGVHCHNDLGMAVANTVAGIRAGAGHIEGSMCGIGERTGNAATEELIMVLKTRGESLGAACRCDSTHILRTAARVTALTGQIIAPNKPIIGENVFSHESGIHQHGLLLNQKPYAILTPESVGRMDHRMVLGKLSGRHGLEQRLTELGYQFSKATVDKLFEQFKQIADRKAQVTDQELEALVRNFAHDRAQAYRLDYFHIVSGGSTIATATVRVGIGEKTVQEAATGKGPVDAMVRAISRAVGREDSVSLADYQLQAVTGGQDALGEVRVRVRGGEHICLGRGVSTDIIEASAQAYIDALNRLSILESGDAASSAAEE